MSIVVEAIESVFDAVDKYIVEPIKNDPLTFIATVAGAAFLGPAAAGMLGTSATVGAGVGAALGNTAAGLAQGESFDEAIKGGALAGVTTWAGGELVNKFGSSSTPSSASTLQKGITSTADDFANVGAQTTDDIFSAAAKSSADDFINPGSSSYFKPTTGGAPYGANAGLGLADDAFSLADDAFSKGAPIDPTNPFSPQSVSAPRLPTTTTPPPSSGGGVYTGQKIAGMSDATANAASYLDDAAASGLPRSATDPLYYKTFDGSATGSSSTAGANQGFLDSPIMQYGTGDLSRGIMNSPTPNTPPSMWDKALGYAGKAYDWAVDNPQYSVPLALSAASLLGQDKPPPPPSGSQGQIGDPSFYEPLDLYRMNRGQLGYEGDIYSYGTQGGEHDFFSPTVYEPIKYAQGGDVAPMRDNPMRDEYGYYTYGQIPRTMRKFAKGGLSALATQEGFDGRSDDIPAVLSDGEFVIDAETVALLGNGSSKAGANKLEQMRQAVRKQKGGALSQGKFSPDAKHPLAYLKSSKRGRG